MGPQQRGAGLMGMFSGQPTNPMSMVAWVGPQQPLSLVLCKLWVYAMLKGKKIQSWLLYYVRC